MKKCGLIFLLFLPLIVGAQTIITIAGGGSGHDGVPATAASLYDPIGMVVDNKGNLYIAEQLAHDIRKVDTAGIITTYAGTGSAGYGGDNGPATVAQLNQPNGITLDSLGNLFIADAVNCRIRKVDATTGIITTVCGNGTPGYSGDNGPASAAILYYPGDVLFDKSGNLYITSANDGTIRKINTAGIITTIAGTGTFGDTGDGGQATAANISPTGICFDKLGNIYIGNDQYSVVRKIDTFGIITRYAGDSGQTVYNGDGIPALSAYLESAWVASDKNGYIYIADHSNNRIRMIDNSDNIRTVAGNGTVGSTGDGGPAIAAEITHPGAIYFDKCGNLYIAQVDQPRIRKVAFNPNCWAESVQTVAATHTINIYPNPTYNELTIATSDKINTITIYNLIGQAVYTKQYNNEKAVVNIAALPEGMYMVEVTDGEGKRTIKKIIKQ